MRSICDTTCPDDVRYSGLGLCLPGQTGSSFCPMTCNKCPVKNEVLALPTSFHTVSNILEPQQPSSDPRVTNCGGMEIRVEDAPQGTAPSYYVRSPPQYRFPGAFQPIVSDGVLRWTSANANFGKVEVVVTLPVDKAVSLHSTNWSSIVSFGAFENVPTVTASNFGGVHMSGLCNRRWEALTVTGAGWITIDHQCNPGTVVELKQMYSNRTGVLGDDGGVTFSDFYSDVRIGEMTGVDGGRVVALMGNIDGGDSVVDRITLAEGGSASVIAANVSTVNAPSNTTVYFEGDFEEGEVANGTRVVKPFEVHGQYTYEWPQRPYFNKYGWCEYSPEYLPRPEDPSSGDWWVENQGWVYGVAGAILLIGCCGFCICGFLGMYTCCGLFRSCADRRRANRELQVATPDPFPEPYAAYTAPAATPASGPAAYDV